MINKVKYFFTNFLPEVRAEWKKVTRPSRREVVQTTMVVIVTSFIFAVFLWAVDQSLLWLSGNLFETLGGS